MSQGLSRKIIEYALTFLVIVSMNFFLPRLMPGDPFTFLSTEEGSITIIYTKEQIDRYKAYYGLDQPLLRQYVTYLACLGRGDLGYSIYFNETVGRIILNRIPWTLTISIIALVLGGLGGTLLGSLS
ncbi:MAG TPA: ABC transporter permease, partial [Firmicutes bacterium]|nr:ABC transporter permease [Bacillota bacterium]